MVTVIQRVVFDIREIPERTSPHAIQEKLPLGAKIVGHMYHQQGGTTVAVAMPIDIYMQAPKEHWTETITRAVKVASLKHRVTS